MLLRFLLEVSWLSAKAASSMWGIFFITSKALLQCSFFVSTSKAIRDEESDTRKAILWMKGYTYLWKETHCDCLCSGRDSGEKNFGLVLSRRLHSDWIDCFMFCGTVVKWGFVLPFRASSGPLQEWGLTFSMTFSKYLRIRRGCAWDLTSVFSFFYTVKIPKSLTRMRLGFK